MWYMGYHTCNLNFWSVGIVLHTFSDYQKPVQFLAHLLYYEFSVFLDFGAETYVIEAITSGMFSSCKRCQFLVTSAGTSDLLAQVCACYCDFIVFVQ